MKKKLKKLFYLSLLLSGLILVGCELQEDVIENHNHHEKIRISTKQFSELINEKNFSNSFRKIPKRKITSNINGRTVLEDSYGFTIYDAPVQVIESDSLVTYTLLIQSDKTNKDENIVENLIINEYSIQNTTSIFTIKYAFDPLVKVDETNFHTLKYSSTVTPLVIDNKVFTEEMRGMMECVRIQELMCCHDPNDNLGGCHTPFGQCYKDNTVFWGSVSVNCSSGGGGPSGNYGPTEVGNTGPGPHGGSPTTGNVYTSPVPSCKSKNCAPILDNKTPCEQLKNTNNRIIDKTDNSTTTEKELLISTKNEVEPTGSCYSSGNEKGNVVVSENNVNIVIPFEIDAPNVGQTSLNLVGANNTPLNVVVFMHTHGIIHYSVPSLDDIHSIYAMITNGNINDTDNFTFYILSAHGTVYALRIEDKNAFMEWGYGFFYGNAWQNDTIGIMKKMRNDSFKEAGVKEPKDITNFNTNTYVENSENGLAKFLKNSGNNGIGLYRNTDNNFNNWSKIEMNSLGQKRTTPCL